MLRLRPCQSTKPAEDLKFAPLPKSSSKVNSNVKTIQSLFYSMRQLTRFATGQFWKDCTTVCITITFLLTQPCLCAKNYMTFYSFDLTPHNFLYFHKSKGKESILPTLLMWTKTRQKRCRVSQKTNLKNVFYNGIKVEQVY